MWNDDSELRTIIREPQIKHDSLVDGVIVPGLQCAITGVLSGMAAGTLAAFANLNGWKWGAGVFVVVTLLSWLAFRQGWNNRLERMLGLDLNLDGTIGGQPQPPVMPAPNIRVELIQDQGRVGDYIDLPYPEKLPAFAAGLLNGRQFAQTAWVGNGRLFSRAEFEILRDRLVERGLAEWRNPEAKAQGVVLTAAGRAVMKRLMTLSPTLPEDHR